MKKILQQLRMFILLSVFVAVTIRAGATTFLWNLPAPGANNWNVNANWLPATGNPGAADTAVFGPLGTSPNATTINNVVSVNTAIISLQYSNVTSDTWHVTQIPTGVTLTTFGNVIVGGFTSDHARTSAAMTGGGTFRATGNIFTVGDSGTTTLSQPSILDLTGLTNFVYNASAGTIGLGIADRSVGSLYLANGSNNVTVGTISLDTGSTSSSGQSGNLKFGAGTNVINVGTINVGAGRTAGTINFVTSTGGLRLRGTAGGDADRVTTIVLGNRNTGSSTPATTTGTINFNGHPVDAKIATLTLGQNSQTANTNLSGVGNFQFDQGTVDITTVNMGVCGGNSSTLSLTNGAIGTLTVDANGTLLVNSISLGNVTSTAQGSFASGTLFINGGTAVCSNNIVKTTSLLTTGTVVVATGTLFVQSKVGSPGNPVDNLNVTNATLRLVVDASGAITTNICVNSVNAGGTTTIDIAQVTGVTGLMTFPLVAYNTLNGTVAGNFTVTVPAGYYGSLVDNSAQKRIDLSIIQTVKPKPGITNISLSGTTLTIQATNGSLGGQYVLLGTTNVALPLNQWTPILTNYFDANGNLNLSTNILNPALMQQFYILSQ